MTKTHFSITRILSLFVTLSLASDLFAQTKVVVIPLAGNDVAMAQQYHRYPEFITATSAETVRGCTSNFFRTPDQPIQVRTDFNASTYVTQLESYWSVNVEYRQNGGSWSFRQPSTFSGGAANTWQSQSSFDFFNLDPNTTYQYRVRLSGLPNNVTHHYCRLLLTFSYKLPEDKEVVTELLPLTPL